VTKGLGKGGEGEDRSSEGEKGEKRWRGREEMEGKV